jgi:hypothetical protein
MLAETRVRHNAAVGHDQGVTQPRQPDSSAHEHGVNQEIADLQAEIVRLRADIARLKDEVQRTRRDRHETPPPYL